MNILTEIRPSYRPIQPSVSSSDGSVSYREFAPVSPLQDYIYCYWELKTNQPLTEPFPYKVVADGCMDVFFERSQPQENFVMGFSTQVTEFPLTGSFQYIGIRFLPTMFPQFFNINAAELRNRTEPLADVVPGVSRFIAERFSQESSLEFVLNQLNQFFLETIRNVDFNTDRRIYAALVQIFTQKGIVSIEKDLDTGISARQLRRLFSMYVGDTAKGFSKIVRFQEVLRWQAFNPNSEETPSYLDAGYYDQAHFIKDFKSLSGVTPSQGFKP